MLNTREKLIELLGADTCKKECEDCKYCANPEECIEYLKTSMADHLIANGVTMEAYDCHWATETAYKNGYAQGMKDATKWISVKDRLPENREDVLVVAFWHERWNVQWGWYAPNGKVWHVGLMEKTDYPVSHWMPLPEPPKGE